jgi:hypothetical protein
MPKSSKTSVFFLRGQLGYSSVSLTISGPLAYDTVVNEGTKERSQKILACGEDVEKGELLYNC